MGSAVGPRLCLHVAEIVVDPPPSHPIVEVVAALRPRVRLLGDTEEGVIGLVPGPGAIGGRDLRVGDTEDRDLVPEDPEDPDLAPAGLADLDLEAMGAIEEDPVVLQDTQRLVLPVAGVDIQ